MSGALPSGKAAIFQSVQLQTPSMPEGCNEYRHSIPELPNELYSEILSHYNLALHLDQTTLASFSHCSQRFHDLALPYRFAHITFEFYDIPGNSDSKNLSHFLDFLKESLTICRNIRSLQLIKKDEEEVKTDMLHKILCSLPHLCTLTLRNFPFLPPVLFGGSYPSSTSPHRPLIKLSVLELVWPTPRCLSILAIFDLLHIFGEIGHLDVRGSDRSTFLTTSRDDEYLPAAVPQQLQLTSFTTNCVKYSGPFLTIIAQTPLVASLRSLDVGALSCVDARPLGKLLHVVGPKLIHLGVDLIGGLIHDDIQVLNLSHCAALSSFRLRFPLFAYHELNAHMWSTVTSILAFFIPRATPKLRTILLGIEPEKPARETFSSMDIEEVLLPLLMEGSLESVDITVNTGIQLDMVRNFVEERCPCFKKRGVLRFRELGA